MNLDQWMAKHYAYDTPEDRIRTLAHVLAEGHHGAIALKCALMREEHAAHWAGLLRDARKQTARNLTWMGAVNYTFAANTWGSGGAHNVMLAGRPVPAGRSVVTLTIITDYRGQPMIVRADTKNP